MKKSEFEKFLDRQLKKEVLSNGFYDSWKEAKFQAYAGDDSLQRAFLYDLDNLYPILMCGRISQAQYKRFLRVKERVTDLVLTGKAVFLTLTFDDARMDSISDKNKRQYVSRFLKSNFPRYVANIDFGSKFHRLHYHALVEWVDDATSLDWWREHCGYIDMEVVGNTEDDLKKVSQYVVKLSKHAMKCNDGISPRIIYSR